MKFSPEKNPKGYCLMVDSLPLYRKALELGHTNVFLFEGDEFTPEIISALRETENNLAFIYFEPEHDDPEEPKAYLRQLQHHDLEQYGIKTSSYNLIDSIMFFSRDNATLEDALDHFLTVEALDNMMVSEGLAKVVDYGENLCGNCHETLDPEDRYCRYCGTERGKGEFLPFYNPVYCVYGPPIDITYRCAKCGHSWVSSTLGGDDAKYCPQCGTKSVKVIEYKEGF